MTKDEFKSAMDDMVSHMTDAADDLKIVQSIGKGYIEQAENNALYKHWLTMASDRSKRLIKEIRELEKVWNGMKKGSSVNPFE